MHSDRDARIRQRAYEIWEAEGRPHGKEHEHWRRAEQEVAHREAAAAAAGSTAATTAPRRSRGQPPSGSAGDSAAPRTAPGGTALPRRGRRPISKSGA